MLNKQLSTIIVSAVLILALALTYFLVVAPMLKEDAPKGAPTLLEGEEYDSTNDKIMIFPTFEKEDISNFKIHNSHGDYGFYQDTDGEFYITDYKNTPYDKEKFSNLVSSIRLPMAIKRVTEDTSDLAQYGLEVTDETPYYEVTAKDGTTHKVYIGNVAPTGGAYYAMYEGRDAVYALDTSTEYILRSIESYVTPLLSFPTATDDYYATQRFTLTIDGETFIDIEYMDEAERAKTASTSYYKMLCPGEYVPSSSNYDHILKKFNSFEGTKVLAFGEANGVIAPEVLEKYNLTIPKYEIYYKYSDVDNYVLVSEKNENGSYYAYSLIFNIIAEVSADTLDFLEWELLDFIDKPLFQKNINDIDTIEIEGENVHETFKITGNGGEENTLAVTPESKGQAFDPNELTYFKKIYVKMLSLALEDYTESKSTDEWIMTMRVTTRKGLEYEYKFYTYSTRRCYYTVNGQGEFYLLRDRVEKILSDVDTLMSGGEITNAES